MNKRACSDTAEDEAAKHCIVCTSPVIFPGAFAEVSQNEDVIALEDEVGRFIPSYTYGDSITLNPMLPILGAIGVALAALGKPTL